MPSRAHLWPLRSAPWGRTDAQRYYLVRCVYYHYQGDTHYFVMTPTIGALKAYGVVNKGGDPAKVRTTPHPHRPFIVQRRGDHSTSFHSVCLIAATPGRVRA